jgi:hypothetical protein
MVFRARDLILINLKVEEFMQDFFCVPNIWKLICYFATDSLKFSFKNTDRLVMCKETVPLLCPEVLPFGGEGASQSVKQIWIFLEKSKIMPLFS